MLLKSDSSGSIEENMVTLPNLDDVPSVVFVASPAGAVTVFETEKDATVSYCKVEYNTWTRSRCLSVTGMVSGKGRRLYRNLLGETAEESR